MNEQQIEEPPELEAVGLPPEQAPSVADQPPPPPQQAQEPPEDAGLEVYEHEGEQLVTLKALQAIRKENKELKQQAGKVPQLEAEVNRFRPYAEFLDKHPQLLQPQPPDQPPSTAHHDPHLDAYARRFDLYTHDGKPDVERAKAILDDTRRIAREEATKVLEPVAQQTYESRAGENVRSILATTKMGNGQPLEEKYLGMAIGSIGKGMPREDVVKLLADPNVASVVATTALGLQAAAVTAPVQQGPTNLPLHIERAGGGTDSITLSDADKARAKRYGLKEADMLRGKQTFKPGQSNRLEED